MCRDDARYRQRVPGLILPLILLFVQYEKKNLGDIIVCEPSRGSFDIEGNQVRLDKGIFESKRGEYNKKGHVGKEIFKQILHAYDSERYLQLLEESNK